MKHTAYRISGIAAALFVVCTGRGVTPSRGQPLTAPSDGIDYQKTAGNIASNPNSASVMSYWPSDQGKYSIRMDIPPGEKLISQSFWTEF